MKSSKLVVLVNKNKLNKIVKGSHGLMLIPIFFILLLLSSEVFACINLYYQTISNIPNNILPDGRVKIAVLPSYFNPDEINLPSGFVLEGHSVLTQGRYEIDFDLVMGWKGSTGGGCVGLGLTEDCQDGRPCPSPDSLCNNAIKVGGGQFWVYGTCQGGNAYQGIYGDVAIYKFQMQSCYSGPSGTENIGMCKAGTRNGQWGACQGEVLPATEICGDGKDNNCDGKTDEGCCDITTRVSSTDVWPQKAGSDKTTSTIMVSLNKPAPSEGCNVKFTVEPIEHSGGHSHGGNRPKGTITPNNISFSSGQMGAKNATYKSSEVSGEEKIKIKVNEKDNSEETIKIEVPNFFELGAGDVYTLIGQASTHPGNHFGIEEALFSLMDIANAYNESTKGTLRINDISLIGGGLFDYKANWSTPHKSHRAGRNVDVDDVNVEGKKVTAETLKKISEKIGAKVKILDEGNHLHLTFP